MKEKTYENDEILEVDYGLLVQKRIYDLCKIHKMTTNKLANQSLLTQSTVQNIMSGKSKNPKLNTIITLCNGLGISVKEFFDTEEFNNLR